MPNKKIKKIMLEQVENGFILVVADSNGYLSDEYAERHVFNSVEDAMAYVQKYFTTITIPATTPQGT